MEPLRGHARFDGDAQKTIEQGHDPANGGHHGIFQMAWIYYYGLYRFREAVTATLTSGEPRE
jgi:hypothetical protein